MEEQDACYVATDTALLAAMAGDAQHGDRAKFAAHLGKPGVAAEIDLHAVTMAKISPQHPDFAAAYAMLQQEFGAKGEVETEDVLRTRSRWDPLHPASGSPPLIYHLIILKHPQCAASPFRSADGQVIIGVRDHNIIYREGMIIVHLSHSLLVEHARGKGLDTVLRSIPVVDARSFAQLIGQPAAPIILYAEQEPVPTPAEIQEAALHHWATGEEWAIDDINMRLRRLAAYQGGSFKKIGVSSVCSQPDFSTAAQITAKGGPELVDLNGIWRFVDHDDLTATTGRIVRIAVAAVYDMYEASALDPRAIVQARASLCSYPREDAVVPLIRPLDAL